MWDLSDPTQPRRLGQPLTGHTGSVITVAFSSNGTTLATGSNDGTAILWDLSNRAQPRRLGRPLTGHTGSVFSVAFAPDGTTLATGGTTLAAGGTDGTVILWDLTGLNDLLDHAVERACSFTGRGLDHEEWSRFIPGLPYLDTCSTT